MGKFDLFKPNVEEMEKRKDINGLMKALKHEDGNVRWRAVEALGRIGEPAVEPLIHALKDEDRNVRWRAAEVLGNIGDAKAVEPLIQALMDGDSSVRKHAARALGRIRDARAVEPLAQALRDKSSEVRWEAAEVLDELSWKPRNDAEKAHYLIAKVAWGELVILGEPAIEPLIQALKDEDKFVREAAEEALEKIKAHMLAKIHMTKSLAHVIIYTEEPFEANEANIVGCMIAAFPEESKEFVKEFDLATGSFILHEKKFGYSLVRSITFKDRKTRDNFMSWIKSVKKGVHDLPRECEAFIKLIGSPSWGAIFFPVLLERVNPEFAISTSFIRKWSVIDGKFLVIGVYSIVPQEVPAAPYTVPAPPQPEAPKPLEAPPTKKYCMYCGAAMRLEAVYCPRCGKKQVEEEVKSIKEAEAHFKKGVTILDENVRLFPGFTQSSTAALSAAEEFKKAAELVPTSADYRYFYAVALRWGLQFKSAEEEIKKVLEIDPNHFEAKKTVEYGHPKWKDAFNYPRWSEASTSIPEVLKPLLPELRPGLAGGTRVIIVRDGARKIVSFLNKSLRSSWYRPLSMDIKMKIELVHSKTPYGSIIASYLVVGDDPTRPYISETFLNPNKPGEEFHDACQLGQNLLRILFQQDYAYLIFVDENNVVMLNKKLVFDAAMRGNLMEIEKALNEVDRLGETMEHTKLLQAGRWHSNNFPLSNIKL